MLDTPRSRTHFVSPGRPVTRPFRIAMVAACPFPAPRGTPIRIHRTAEALAGRGHSVDVFTYHLGDLTGDEPFSVHRIARIPTYRKQDPGPSYQKLLIMDPLLAAKVTWATRGRRYDIVHAHHCEGLLVSLPGRSLHGTPVVFDVHTLLESELPSYSLGLPKSWLSGIGRSLDRRLPLKSDHVIAVSEEIRTRLLHSTGLPTENISMIPNGIEPFFLKDSHPPVPRSSSSEAPYLVYAGNLASYQGIDLLFKAFAKAHEARPSLRLRLLTSSPLGDYECLARQLGVREFIDVADPKPEPLAAVLRGAAAAANPRGDCSGLPQKLLNYMAAGCAVVSCAGSAKHLEDGRSGLIVANDDVAAFSDAILRLVDDRPLGERLGSNARTYVRENLSWDKTAERFEAIYDGLCRRQLHA